MSQADFVNSNEAELYSFSSLEPAVPIFAHGPFRANSAIDETLTAWRFSAEKKARPVRIALRKTKERYVTFIF